MIPICQLCYAGDTKIGERGGLGSTDQFKSCDHQYTIHTVISQSNVMLLSNIRSS